ncbi:hypothetical protein [Acinetobacter sp. P1(2025)]|uniref:hypothetical protein n=1 Tax=Acinetobacter sp. P1(2025) TaxID=3446120 RepID=UPI003F52E535
MQFTSQPSFVNLPLILENYFNESYMFFTMIFICAVSVTLFFGICFVWSKISEKWFGKVLSSNAMIRMFLVSYFVGLVLTLVTLIKA